MELCSYGCGNEAKYIFKNGKKCCSKSTSKCAALRKINSEKHIGGVISEEAKKKISNSKKGRKRVFTDGWRKNLSNSHKGITPWNKGLIKETDVRVLKQASFGMKGKRHKEGFKEKHRERMKNFRHSDETKMKISKIRIERGLAKGKNNSMFGKKHTEKTKRKQSELKKDKYCGEHNPNWKGGISCEPYCDVWLDKDFRESILERDNHQCQNPDCWQKNGVLTIHHIDYNKKNCRPDNLITLCNSCNARANFNREQWTKFYKEIVESKYN